MKNHEIQNIRAIGMFAVLIGHMPIAVPYKLMHGWTFVNLFFVISGYLAVVSFNKRYAPTLAPSSPHTRLPALKIIKIEIVNRAFRLLPLMVIWILIYFIVGATVTYYGGQYGDMDRWIGELKAAATLSYNYYLASLDVGGMFGQYWSLFVEIHFFVLFILLFVFVRGKRSRIIASVGIILLTMFVFRPLTPAKLVRFATLTYLDSLFAGVLVGLCCENKIYIKAGLSPWTKRIIGSILCLALLFAGYVLDDFCKNDLVKYSAVTLLSTIILFLARERNGWFDFPGWLGKVLTWCGDISASVYVTHVLLYSCLYFNLYYCTTWIPEIIRSTPAGHFLQILFLLVAPCFLGWISYRLIEVPYGLLAKKYLNKQLQNTDSAVNK